MYIYSGRTPKKSPYSSFSTGGWPGRSKIFHPIGYNPSTTQIRCVTEWRHRCTWVSVKGKGKGQGWAKKKRKLNVSLVARVGTDVALVFVWTVAGRLETTIGTHYWNSTGLLPELLAEGKTPFEVTSCWLEGRRESGSPTSGSTTGGCCSRILRSFVLFSRVLILYIVRIIFYFL